MKARHSPGLFHLRGQIECARNRHSNCGRTRDSRHLRAQTPGPPHERRRNSRCWLAKLSLGSCLPPRAGAHKAERLPLLRSSGRRLSKIRSEQNLEKLAPAMPTPVANMAAERAGTTGTKRYPRNY